MSHFLLVLIIYGLRHLFIPEILPNKPKFFKLNNIASNKLRSDVEKISATSEFESRNTESERGKK